LVGGARALIQLQLRRCQNTTSEHDCRFLSTLQRAGKYEPLIAQAALKHQVDPRLLWTIAYLETRFQPESVSPKGARGMMQFMPLTAAHYGLFTLQKIHDPNASIDAAARYLRDLMRRFDNRVDLILATYNAGEVAVIAYRSGQKLSLHGGRVINPRAIRTNGVPPYPETLRYVERGLAILKALATSGIFPPALVADCQPGLNETALSQQVEVGNSVPVTHSVYIVDKSRIEKMQTVMDSNQQR
jgi:lysozyme